MRKGAGYSFGIQEEYLLRDQRTSRTQRFPAVIAPAQASATKMPFLNSAIAEKRMNRITSCTGCGHALVPMLTAKGRVEPSCFWCEGLDARALDMAKWADSPFGKPERSVRQSFE
jgi:hypothetical protein